jgi:hypothetical protein
MEGLKNPIWLTVNFWDQTNYKNTKQTKIIPKFGLFSMVFGLFQRFLQTTVQIPRFLQV